MVAVPGSAAHDRTSARKHNVLAWMRILAGAAGARPGQLARSLSLLLDGGLAVG